MINRIFIILYFFPLFAIAQNTYQIAILKDGTIIKILVIKNSQININCAIIFLKRLGDFMDLENL